MREGNNVTIRHNEANRFAIGARNVQTERRGINSDTIIELGNGVRIVNETDARRPSAAALAPRSKRPRDHHHRQQRRLSPRRRPMFLHLPPPVIRIPRERYILDADRAGPATSTACSPSRRWT